MQTSSVYLAPPCVALLMAPSRTWAVEAGDRTPVHYPIDTVHPELTFRIRHLLARVAGTFRDWCGTMIGDEVWIETAVEAVHQ